MGDLNLLERLQHDMQDPTIDAINKNWCAAMLLSDEPLFLDSNKFNRIQNDKGEFIVIFRSTLIEAPKDMFGWDYVPPRYGDSRRGNNRIMREAILRVWLKPRSERPIPAQDIRGPKGVTGRFVIEPHWQEGLKLSLKDHVAIINSGGESNKYGLEIVKIKRQLIAHDPDLAFAHASPKLHLQAMALARQMIVDAMESDVRQMVRRIERTEKELIRIRADPLFFDHKAHKHHPIHYVKPIGGDEAKKMIACIFPNANADTDDSDPE